MQNRRPTPPRPLWSLTLRPFTLGLFALWPLSLPLLAACAGPQLKDGVYEDTVVRYSLDAPGEGWVLLQLEQANVAWRHPLLNASLLVNSHCEGVEDASLEVLTRHLLMGMTQAEVLAEERSMLSGRAALETTVAAKLDGVPRKLKLLVLKKDGCVYDLVLDARPDTFEGAAGAYRRVRESLEVHPRRDWS